MGRPPGTTHTQANVTVGRPTLATASRRPLSSTNRRCDNEASVNGSANGASESSRRHWRIVVRVVNRFLPPWTRPALRTRYRHERRLFQLKRIVRFDRRLHVNRDPRLTNYQDQRCAAFVSHEVDDLVRAWQNGHHASVVRHACLRVRQSYHRRVVHSQPFRETIDRPCRRAPPYDEAANRLRGLPYPGRPHTTDDPSADQRSRRYPKSVHDLQPFRQPYFVSGFAHGARP